MEILNILGQITGILGFAYAFYTTKQFSKGIKIGALNSIRTLINRMEEDKNKISKETSEWITMHHTQQNLEDLFKNLRIMFRVNTNKELS